MTYFPSKDVYGLYTARNVCPSPVIVSIQGMLQVYHHHIQDGLSLCKVLDVGNAGLLSWLCFARQQALWRARGLVEQEIIAKIRIFLGRTVWDAVHVRTVNTSGY